MIQFERHRTGVAGVTASENERRQADAIKFGKVQEADYTKARVRVLIGDENDDEGHLLTGWLPMPGARASNDSDWHPLEVGERVAVISESGDTPNGVVIPAGIFNSDFPAPGNKAGLWVRKFKDGGQITYDRDTGEWLMEGLGKVTHKVGDSTIVADENAVNVTKGSSSVKLTAGAVDVTADTATVKSGETQLKVAGSGVNVTGNMSVAGEVAATGFSGPGISGGGGGGGVGGPTTAQFDALQSEVDGKADESDLTALTETVSGKEPAIATGDTTQFWRGDKTWQTLSRAAVGLGNVDNTADANKPVSTATQTALNLKLDASKLGQPNGAASLDATGRVPAVQLPSYVDDVLEAANFAALPGTGETGKIYVTLDTNKTFRWSGTAYVEISASPGSTDSVVEGSANLYFTGARVLATIAIGLADTSGNPTAGDSILTVLGKTRKAVFTDLPVFGPQGYGAVGNGTADDSAAFVTGIASKLQITPAAGKSYAIKDVTLSNSQSVSGVGQVFSAATGATSIFKLADYNPRLAGIYISAATGASSAAVLVLKSRYANLEGITAVNCGNGFINFTPANPATDAIAMPIMDKCDAEGVSGIAINIGSSVSEIRASNCHLHGQLVTGTGGNQRPSFTSVGWRQNTPVFGTLPVGGHQVNNVNLIGFNRAFYLSEAQLSKFSNCVADSCSDYAALIDGASQYIDFDDFFVGTSRGIKVMGASHDIHFDGLRTLFGGTIPPWGSTDFYNGVSTFYDLEVRDTAQVRVSNWQGSKRIAVDATAKLIVQDGITFHARTVGQPGPGVTTFLCEWGSTGTEGDTLWRAPYDGYLIRLCPSVVTAPGTGQSFTYTARVANADTALVATIADGNFGNVDVWAGVLIPVSKAQAISLKLVTSAGAAAARHQVQLQFVPR